MQILRPDQFSDDPLTVHLELEETMSPYIESGVYNPAYFQAVVQKAYDLFDALFAEGGPIVLVYHVYGNSFAPTHLFRFIRDRDARYKATLTRSVLEEEVVRTYTVHISDKSQLRVYALLEAICHQDFRFSPRLCRRRGMCPYVQFIHQKAGHVLFVYDDRGAYVRGTSPEHLQALKQKISPPLMPNRT